VRAARSADATADKEMPLESEGNGIRKENVEFLPKHATCEGFHWRGSEMHYSEYASSLSGA